MGFWDGGHELKTSRMAGIDLQTSEAIQLVNDSHTSDAYIVFRKIFDEKYPKNDKIGFVLDNLKLKGSISCQDTSLLYRTLISRYNVEMISCRVQYPKFFQGKNNFSNDML